MNLSIVRNVCHAILFVNIFLITYLPTDRIYSDAEFQKKLLMGTVKVDNPGFMNLDLFHHSVLTPFQVRSRFS